MISSENQVVSFVFMSGILSQIIEFGLLNFLFFSVISLADERNVDEIASFNLLLSIFSEVETFSDGRLGSLSNILGRIIVIEFIVLFHFF